MSDRLLEVLRPAVAPLFADEDAYVAAFERFELLLVVAYAHGDYAQWATGKREPRFPAVRALWRHDSTYAPDQSAMTRLRAEVDGAGDDWFLLRRGVLGGSRPLLDRLLAAVLARASAFL